MVRLTIMMIVVLSLAVGMFFAWNPSQPESSTEDEYQQKPANSLTFAEHIAPVVYQKCSGCHRPGESAPFSLITYDDVKQRTKQIADVTQSRFMPPWLPQSKHLQFVDDRSLSTEELGMLQQWISEGAPLGNPSLVPDPPQWIAGWQLGAPDLVVKMKQAFEIPADGEDIFRNFVIPIELDQRQYIQGVEFRWDHPEVVHHAVLLVDRTTSSQELDQEDPQPGFEGMSANGPRAPDGYFIGWTPGKTAKLNREQLSWRIHPGDDLVLQLHLQPIGKPTSIRGTIGLHFADHPSTERPVMLKLGSQTIDIPANEKNYVVKDEYQLPHEVELLSLYPHAHYLCESMKATAFLPSGKELELFTIREWDFNWQDAYSLEKSLTLPKDTTLKMEYHFNNSASNPRNPQHPPKRIVFGPHTKDEMADLWIQVMPKSKEERISLEQHVSLKELQSTMAGYHQILKRNPQDASTHLNLAGCYKQLSDLEQALSHLQKSVEINPKSAKAHNNLANLYQQLEKFQIAEHHYQQALEIDGSYAKAHNNRGTLLQKLGNLKSAQECYQQAIEANPNYATAHYHLANLLQSRGQLITAIKHYQQAVRTNPEHLKAHLQLGVCLQLRGRFEEAIQHFQTALELQPNLQFAQQQIESTKKMMQY